MKKYPARVCGALLPAVLLLTFLPLTAHAVEGPAAVYDADRSSSTILFTKGEAPVFEVFNGVYGSLDNTSMAGVTYDRDSNTLTLSGLDAPDLNLTATCMGDDFTIRVEGDCALRMITVSDGNNAYSTSCSIVGDGALTVGEEGGKDDFSAIYMKGAGANPVGLSVADSVTLRLYSSFQKQLIVCANTALDTPEEAITIGGMPVEGVERTSPGKFSVNVHTITDSGTLEPGKNDRIMRSRFDPESLYIATPCENKGNYAYKLRRIVYVKSLNAYALMAGLYGADTAEYVTQQALDNCFTPVTEQRTVSVRYTNEELVSARGQSGFQVVNSADPDGIYVAYQDFGSSQGEYTVYRLIWDKAEDYYVADPGTAAVVLKEQQFKQAGYSFVYENSESPLEAEVWETADFDSSDNWMTLYPLYQKKGAANTLYAMIDSGLSEDNSTIYLMQKIRYSKAQDAYYLDSDEGWIGYTAAELAAGFAQVTERKQVSLRFLTRVLPYDWYSVEGMMLQKDGDPGAVYSYAHYENDEGGDPVYVVRLTLNETDRRYYETLTALYNSEAEMFGAGYAPVTEEIPVSLAGERLYTVQSRALLVDKDGRRLVSNGKRQDGWLYFAVLDESKTVTVDGKLCYFPVADEEIDLPSLPIVYDDTLSPNSYVLRGAEFSAPPAPTVLPGDVNGNGVVDIGDVTEIQQHLAQMKTLTGDALTAADADGDGDITIADATLIQRYLAEFIDSL